MALDVLVARAPRTARPRARTGAPGSRPRGIRRVAPDTRSGRSRVAPARSNLGPRVRTCRGVSTELVTVARGRHRLDEPLLERSQRRAVGERRRSSRILGTPGERDEGESACADGVALARSWRSTSVAPPSSGDGRRSVTSPPRRRTRAREAPRRASLRSWESRRPTRGASDAPPLARVSLAEEPPDRIDRRARCACR